MELVTDSLLRRYLADDSIAKLLAVLSRPEDEGLTSQRWLAESAPKRLILERLYGDLLRAPRRVRVLDIGGGLTAITRELARRHDYTLVDLLAHDNPELAEAMVDTVGRQCIWITDWYELRAKGIFDVVVANDLFPNVDQRLELFLERFLPQAREVRLSLTYYDTPRFYLTRRIGADEILCMLAWNGRVTRAALEPYKRQIRNAQLDLLTTPSSSVFPNGRQVCFVTLDGTAP